MSLLTRSIRTPSACAHPCGTGSSHRQSSGRALALLTAVALALGVTAGAAQASPAAAAAPAHLAAAALQATKTTLTSSRNPAYTAQTGGVTAKVKGTTALGVPTGTVDFYVDGDYWWTETLDTTGKAKLLYANIIAGSHTISAVYSGDVSYASSTSADLAQTVLATAPTTAMTFTPASVAPGGVSRLVLSATNNTPVSMPNLAIGLMLPPGAAIVSTPPGVGCRRAWPNLFYCLTSVRPGATRSIVLDVTAPGAATTITASGYARNVDTLEETGATATLTVG